MERKFKKYGVTILISFMALCGCVKDEYVMYPPLPDENTGQAVFTLQLPKNNGSVSRAMTEEQEDAITEMAVLGFVTSGGSEQLSFYTTLTPADIVRDGTDRRKYNVTATMKVGNYSSIVLIANADDVMTANTSELVAGTSRTDIEQALIAEVANGGIWNADSTNPDPIPMFGEATGGGTGITIAPGTSPFSGVSMTRMMARINLSNNAANFTPQQIHLYNFRRNGMIVPGAAGPTLISPPLLHTTMPQYGTAHNEIYVFEQEPSDGNEGSEKPFIIVGGDYGGSGVTSYYRIDFVNRLNDGTPQADNQFIPLLRNHKYSLVIDEVKGPGYATAADAAMCLPFNTVTRIFVFDDGGIENILFDGQYYLAISHETMELDKNEQTEVLHVETDNPLGWKIEPQPGSSWLSIDRTSPGANDDGNLDVKVTAHDNADQTRTGYFVISAGRLEYTLPVTQSYLDGISLEITDTQGEPINEVFFRSHPQGGHSAVNNDFMVHWKGSQCKIQSVVMVGDRLLPLPSTLAEGYTLTAGQENFPYNLTQPANFSPAEVDPETGNPFMEEGAIVTFEVTNGVETITRTLYIRHQCSSIIFDNVTELCYMGHSYNFNVRSNTRWRVSNINTEVNQLFQTRTGQDYSTMENTTGGNDIVTGSRFDMNIDVPVYSQMENWGVGRAGRKMTITFSDDDGVAPDVSRTMIAILPDANSFSVRNGGGTLTAVGDGREGRNGYILIPIRKLFWIWEKELGRPLNHSANGGLNLTADIEWQTFNGLITNTGTSMQFVDMAGNGDYRDYGLLVWTTNGTTDRYQLGNAIISIKTGNEILWSFHVWVSDYFPDHNRGNTFTNSASGMELMSYNLGATVSVDVFTPAVGGTGPGPETGIAGLYYQTGRKDPFPGCRPELPQDDYDLKILSNQAQIYKPGIGQVYIQFAEAPGVKNLGPSINNPMTLYNKGSGLNDWYTTSARTEDQDYNLWRDKSGRKHFYDPCPPGWKVAPSDPAYWATMSDHVRGDGANDSNWIEMPDGQVLFIFGSGILGGFALEYSVLGFYRNAASIHLDYNPGWNVQNLFSYTGLFSIGPADRYGAPNVRCARDTYNWYGNNWN